MTQLLHVPLWLFALLAAMAAPMCVRLFAARVERRTRERTLAVVARAEASMEHVDRTAG
jgi:hypothetical protein